MILLLTNLRYISQKTLQALNFPFSRKDMDKFYKADQIFALNLNSLNNTNHICY